VQERIMDMRDRFFAGICQRARGTEEFVVDGYGLGRSMGLTDVQILELAEGLAAEGLIEEQTVHGGDIVIRLTARGVAQCRAAQS
jgi:hypothetical protein